VPGSGGVAHRTPEDFSTLATSPTIARAPTVALRSPTAPRRRVAPPSTSTLPGSLAAVALLAGLTGAWLIFAPRTPDLAAASYRVSLFAAHGFSVIDANWYGGHDLPGYSLLFPPLGALLGLQAMAAMSVFASSVLFARLSRSLYGSSAAAWGTALFVLAAIGDIWIGRIAFAFGVPFALGAALALYRGHPVSAGGLAFLSAAASPVAGALLALVGLTVSLSQRSPRAFLTLALPPMLIVGVLAVLFPEGGFEPFPLFSFLATAFVVLAFLVALPARARTLRIGGLVYLATCLACLIVPTPMGSNVERYAVLLAGPLLACELLMVREHERLRQAIWPAARRAPVRAFTPAAVVALSSITVFVVWGPVRETLAVAGSEATDAGFYKPVERFLERQTRHEPVRVEVPLTRTHWETDLLARNISLARGWDKQLDERYDGVLLEPGLTARSYQAWLHRQGVGYVALPDVMPDPSSAQEARLIRHGLSYLKLVDRTRHWRIYRVRGATALADGPGRMSALSYDSYTVRAGQAGSFLVRMHFSPYWQITHGAGCLEPGPGGWTRLTVPRAGRVKITAGFSLSRALEGGGYCTTG
jgi:hypothetical protein